MLPRLFLALFPALCAAAPRDSLPLEAPEWPLNYRLQLEGAAKVRLGDDLIVALEPNGPHDLAVEHPADGAPVLRVWSCGKLVRGPEDTPALASASCAMQRWRRMPRRRSLCSSSAKGARCRRPRC